MPLTASKCDAFGADGNVIHLVDIMSFIENRANGVSFMTAPVIRARHGFSTRYGGVSEGIFSSLNLAMSRGDDPDAVEENYRRLTAAVGVDAGKIALTRQVHGNNVRVVTGPDAGLSDASRPECDGLVTAERGLALFCFTADCVPVLLCDTENGVAGAVHCGWRSSVADILGAAVEKMEELGARAESICAAIGPAIGACCFEVGPEVPEAAERLLGEDLGKLCRPEPGREGKFLLDLRGVNRRRLLQLGLRAESIAVSDECTMCLPEKYWSHRATRGQRGCQGALICL